MTQALAVQWLAEPPDHLRQFAQELEILASQHHEREVLGMREVLKALLYC